MIYQKYFKTGQKVQLRAKQPLLPEERNELLSASIHNGDANYFDLILPYGPDAVSQYPFTEDMPFELSADALGLGVKVTVTYMKPLAGDLIRVLVLPDLQMFQRRTQRRIDCTIGIRFTRGKNSLRKLRETWQKNASILSQATQTIPLEGFNPCLLNLSATGIRLSLHPPAQPSDICLMLLDIADSKPPICVLAEIIWTTEKNQQGTVHAGMQYINIMQEDQKRIEHYIKVHS